MLVFAFLSATRIAFFLFLSQNTTNPLLFLLFSPPPTTLPHPSPSAICHPPLSFVLPHLSSISLPSPTPAPLFLSYSQFLSIPHFLYPLLTFLPHRYLEIVAEMLKRGLLVNVPGGSPTEPPDDDLEILALMFNPPLHASPSRRRVVERKDLIEPMRPAIGRVVTRSCRPIGHKQTAHPSRMRVQILACMIQTAARSFLPHYPARTTGRPINVSLTNGCLT